jgi:protein involved in polysaccharide export with SLBB domain
MICALIVAPGCSSQSHSAVVTAHAVIYVDGEFKNNRAIYPWTNGMRLQDAMDAAGGLTDFATRNLRVRHADGSVEKYRLSPHYKPTKNPVLQPGDQIISPRY